ncbi:phage holin family protein [Roseicella aquatilis]|uniref:Phage holin family protein n=1 Tax=Roseicella aquatilis TaxID=2527868 RepID=A0A4R4D5P9_9PROT|nr:phage holin family protein [Roseicella aquatilis]TCZ54987.1 phage holin family protein [Roseicella aquatilis]
MPSDNSRPPERDRSVGDLFGSVIGQISTLFRKEVQLARAELGEKLGDAAGAVTPIAAGGGLLLGALILLLFALVSLLVSFGIATGWSQLIVGLVAALLGYGLIRSGLSHLKASNLVPNRTATQLSRDAQVAKEQVQ